jgi:hypothetical protein
VSAAAVERAPATSSGGRSLDVVARALEIAGELVDAGDNAGACRVALAACAALEDELAERGYTPAIAVRRLRAGELWGPV